MSINHVHLVECLGTDLTVVNSARVSFSKKSEYLTPKDIKLIQYLAKHKHFSPFRHCILQFHIKCPEFVARQLYKHVVGIEITSSHPTKDHAWNEVSGRYVELLEHYTPSVWRKQSTSCKQGSEGQLMDAEQTQCSTIYQQTMDMVFSNYKKLIDMGVCKEQARIMLPMSFMTEFFWTASLQAVANFCALRCAEDAQKEFRELADEIFKKTTEKFPVSFQALREFSATS